MTHFTEADPKQLNTAAIKEALYNITEIRGAFSSQPEHSLSSSRMQNFPKLLLEIHGALHMLGHEDGAKLVNSAIVFSKEKMVNNTPSPHQLALFAEFIICLEYYLQSLSNGSATQTYHDKALHCLKQLGYCNSNPLSTKEETISKKEIANQESHFIQDPELINIFVHETTEVINNLSNIFDSHTIDKNNPQTIKKLHHIMHTLKAGGKIAGATDIGRLASTLDEKTISFGDKQLPVTEDFIASIKESLPVFRYLVNNYAQGVVKHPETERLISRINNIDINKAHAHKFFSGDMENGEKDKKALLLLTQQCLQHVKTLKEFIVLQEQSKYREYLPQPTIDAINKLCDLAHQSELIEFEETSRLLLDQAKQIHNNDLYVSTDFIELLKDYCNSTLEMVAEIRYSEMHLQNEKTCGHTNEDQPPRSELLDVFLNEAGRTLEQARNHLFRWTQAPHDRTQLEGLLRALHTLKGGAYMAGLDYIGNLTHQTESVVESIVQSNDPNVSASTQEALHKRITKLVTLITRHKRDISYSASVFNNQPITYTERGNKTVQSGTQITNGYVPSTTLLHSPGNKLANLDPATAESLADLSSQQLDLNKHIESYVNRLNTQAEEIRDKLSRLNAKINSSTSEATTHLEDHYFDTNSDSASTDHEVRKLITDIETTHNNLYDSIHSVNYLFKQQENLLHGLHQNFIESLESNISKFRQRLERIVEHTSLGVEKKVRLQLEGNEESVDKPILDRLMPSVEHLLRNAIVHGIESPQERRRQFKDETGLVRITFSREKSEFVIKVSDDGAGINTTKVQQKAIHSGLTNNNEPLGHEDIVKLIVKPGFSTADFISQHAGRGIGLNAVHDDVLKLNGELHVDTRPGEGTQFSIRVPFRMSVKRTLLVSQGNRVYAVPTASVECALPATSDRLAPLYQRNPPSFEWKSKQYPLHHLGALLYGEDVTLPALGHHHTLLLLRQENKCLALHVGTIIDVRDSVIKADNPQDKHPKGILGTTLLSDEKSIAILDVPTLLNMPHEHNQQETITAVRKQQTINILVVSEAWRGPSDIPRRLIKLGFSVNAASNLDEANSILNRNHPDVVILDLPETTDFTRFLKSSDRLRKTPIIVTTSNIDNRMRIEASSQGIDALLSKPFSDEDLLFYIKHLNNHSLNPALSSASLLSPKNS